MAQDLRVTEMAEKPAVPSDMEEAGRLMEEIRERQAELRKKIGSKEDKIACLYADIARLRKEIEDAGGVPLMQAQELRAAALAEFVHKNRTELLGGRREGAITFEIDDGNGGKKEVGKVVVEQGPPAVVATDNDHVSAMEILALGKEFWDGTYVTGSLNRKPIKADWEEKRFGDRLHLTLLGSNTILRIRPYVHVLGKKDVERLEVTMPPDATE